MRRGLILLCSTGLLACSTTNTNTQQMHRRVAHIQNATSQEDRSRCDATLPGRSASEYDTNNDGVPDVRKVYQVVGEAPDVHSVLVCREADLNHDGGKDIFRFYNDEGRTLREEEDRNFDGKIDVITFFEGGEVVRQEFDHDGDGQVDERLFFRDHRPFRSEQELHRPTAPTEYCAHPENSFCADHWEFYNAQGHIVRIGEDYDHDGRADRWDRTDRVIPVRYASGTTPASGQPEATTGQGGTTGQGTTTGTPPAGQGTTPTGQQGTTTPAPTTSTPPATH